MFEIVILREARERRQLTYEQVERRSRFAPNTCAHSRRRS